MKRLALGALLLAALAPLPAFPLSPTDAVLTTTLVLIGNTDELSSSGPTPVVIVQSLGASVPLAIAGPFFMEPSLDLFGTWYEYTGTRAVPGARESGTSFFVLGTLLGVRAGAAFPVSPRVVLGASIGLDLLLRIPIDLEAGAAERTGDRRASYGYFYGMGRFLYPETRLFCKWRIAEKFGLVFSVGALHPVFHLWDGEGLAYLDQLALGAGLGFTYSLR
ncbi:MAG: hypothetical protein IMZ69_12115 [Spirochaetes bacterium]|nr:hypothetical protein [Spirochaetota bacterium]